MKSINLSELKYLYASGSNKPARDERFCCFGVFDEGDFLFNSRPDNMDNAFIIKKIKEGTLGPKSSEIAESLKKKHNNSNIFIVVDHDEKEALFFKGENSEDAKNALFKAYGINDEFSYTEKEFVSRNLSEFITLGFSTKKAFSDKSVDLINIRRDIAKFLPIKEYNLDKIAASSKINDKDLTFIVANHELGHSIDKNNPSRPEYDRSPPSMYESHKHETFADIYACLLSTKDRGDSHVAKLWADYRSCDTLRNLGIEGISSYGRDDRASVQTAESVAFYNTAGPLDKLVSFVDEKLKNDKDFFNNLSPENIENLAVKLTSQFALKNQELDALKYEILDSRKGEEKQKIETRIISLFGRNGYQLSENYEMFKQIRQRDREYLSMHYSPSLKQKETSKQVSKDFLELMLEEKKKETDYYTCFLNSHSKLRQKIVSGIDPLYPETSEDKLKALSEISKNNKEDFKPAFAFTDFLDKVQIPEKYKNLGKKDSFESYINTKKAFLNSLKKVNSDISENNITNKTKDEFKNALKNAKYCHFLADKARKAEISDESLLDIVKSDKKYPYPKVLNDFFLNSMASSERISLLTEKSLSLIELVQAKNKRSL